MARSRRELSVVTIECELRQHLTVVKNLGILKYCHIRKFIASYQEKNNLIFPPSRNEIWKQGKL